MGMISQRWLKMKKLWFVMASLAFAGAAAAASLASGDLAPARKSALVHLVRQDCGSCHGMTLKGGLGRPLLPTDLAHWSEDDLAGIILNGIPGTPMPPWRGLLGQDEALWIARKLKSGFPQ